MNPIGSRHEDAVEYLDEWSHEQAPRHVKVRIQNSIGLPELETVPQPDVVWVKRRRYRDRRPQAEEVFLIIHVAESSLDYDLGAKADLYAEAGVHDYWVVDVIHQRVVVMRHPSNGRYQTRETFEIGDHIESLAIPEARLDVRELFSP